MTEPGNPSRGESPLHETQPVIRLLMDETSRLNHQFVHTSERANRSTGLSHARWLTMTMIAERPFTVAQIARRLGLARQSVQRTADLLVSEGLVELHHNPDHRRAKLLSLTAGGRLTLEGAQRVQARWTERVAAAVESEEVETAVELMRTVRDQLDRLDNELGLDG